MPSPEWEAGRQYLPGDIVRPIGQGAVTVDDLDNKDFEGGDNNWTDDAGGPTGSWTIDEVGPTFAGTWSGRAGYTSNPNGASLTVTNDARLPVVAGQPITVRCKVMSETPGSGADSPKARLEIAWFNAGGSPLTSTKLALDPTSVGGYARIDSSGIIATAVQAWTNIEVSGVAPSGAATCTAQIVFTWGDGSFVVDDFEIEYASQDATSPYLFRNISTDSGFSGETEPVWPTVLGNTVVDNEVTWEAISNNFIEWTASRILISGSSEPTFPTMTVGEAVTDNTIEWLLDARRVEDAKCPQTALAAKAGSKIFRADGDLVRFSATTNPLDYTTTEDAGYIPFGLQDYGDQPITAMGLYRGNIAAFNSQGCQIWEVDEDPENFNLLDAVPVPCDYPKSLAPVGDDLRFLTSEGIRALSYAGASVNLQGEYADKAVDPLVEELLAAMIASETVRGLYWAAQGQYWCFFGDVALVLTIHGKGAKSKYSWAEYTFPSAIDDWTILGTDLYLRSGDKIWQVDEDTTTDDYVEATDTGTEFEGVLQWPYIDLDQPGIDKTMLGFDMVATGTFEIMFGFDQSETQEYSVSNSWTAPYSLSGDTLPGKPIPFPLRGPSFAMRVVFDGDQAWQWNSTNLYLKR